MNTRYGHFVHVFRMTILPALLLPGCMPSLVAISTFLSLFQEELQP
jgi:hypothetical protein